MANILMPAVEDAVKFGQPVDEILEEFHEIYSSVHYPPIDVFQTLLMCSAISWDRVDLLDRLLELGYNVNYTFDYSSETPLHLAVYHENEIIIDRLLKAGASVNIESRVRGHSFYNDMRTPVEAACAVSSSSILGLLIKEYDRDLTRKRYTPLHMACRQFSLKCLKYLLNNETARQYAGNVNDVDCDDRHRPDGFTALMLAARNGSDLTKELLLHGASVSMTTARTRTTALHEAVKHCGRWTMGFVATDVAITVRLLVDAGSDVNAIDSSYYTPLALLTSQIPALVRGIPHLIYPYEVDSHRLAVIQVAELLLQSGANPNVSNANPLELIVRYLSSVCSIIIQKQCLRSVPQDVECYDRSIHLESACSALILGRDFIEVLLKYGASPVLGCSTDAVRRNDKMFSFIMFNDYLSLMKMKTDMINHRKQWMLLTELLLDILRLFLLAGDVVVVGAGVFVEVSFEDSHVSVNLGRKLSIEKIVQLRELVRNEISFEEFQAFMNTPVNLKTLCGGVIASSMGRRCLKFNDIDKLGLPQSVQRYILGL